MLQSDLSQTKNSIDIRDSNDLVKSISTADLILSKSYLSVLNSAQIVQQKQNVSENKNFINELNDCSRFFDVTQIVLNKNENVRDKLVSVFNAVGTVGASIIMMIHGEADAVSISFGVKAADTVNIGKYSKVLENSLNGNFPGTQLSSIRKDQLEITMKDYFPQNPSVSTITDIPGFRSEEENKDRQFMQGIEKFVDTMQGQKYTMVLIADPISLLDMQYSRRALENLYSSLVPFTESQYTMGANESDAISHTITEGTTNTVNKSITNTVSHTIGKSSSTTDTKTKGMNISGVGLGSVAGGAVGTFLLPGLGTGLGAMIGGALGGSISGNFSKSHSVTEGTNTSDTNSSSTTNGISFSTSKNESDGTTYTSGTNKSLQIKFENHSVKKLLERIDETLKRYDTCSDLGMWNCAMYCISESEYVSQMAASVYHSIIRGKNSSLENGAVTIWDSDKSKLIANSIKYMEHPFLNVEGMNVTPGTLISSAELAIEAGLPNHSLPGLPVIECAEFGRTVSSYDLSATGENYCVSLGNIFHMHKEEELAVNLNPKSLSSHAFITGSTGSGKSNTVYHILNQLPKIGVKYMVIEPAKGEYKHVFGNKATVYGTNPELSELLRINPFSFPKGIHILEHLDRLIEIFNVCWPMYAAMPAVLKEAVEKSYEDAGWNLTESTNPYGENLYPTFADVTRNIKTIIDSSEYDAENKGAYKGSLITRLKSLTNGINGMIFTTQEISDIALFDENVIVDLSRVGSSETKSLLMGLLVLKLQEYRMTSGLINSDLRHVTVLEEAHNLLKKTSGSQSQDSGNLTGKSVEMLTNSIAEMRTYGEGFIIADQAPGLLDLAVIRNTNTKIIMRLPDLEDRELVGKAANLNDEQITELAKLPKGVAAVYQNEWIEPVLCKISKADITEGKYSYTLKSESKSIDTTKQRLNIAKLLFNGNKVGNEIYEKDLKELGLCASSEVAIRKCLINPPESPRFTKLAPVVKELFPTVYTELTKVYNSTSNVEAWTDCVDSAIKVIANNDIEIETLRDIRQCIITQYVYNELANNEAYQSWRRGGVK